MFKGILKRKNTLEEVSLEAHSRQLFVVEGIAGNGQVMLSGGAFLAGFIHLLKGSDALIGYITVIPLMTGMFQVISPLVFERLNSRKALILKMIVPLRLALALIYLLPLALMPLGVSLKVLVVIYASCYALNAFVMPPFINWLAEVTPVGIRGSYIARRHRLSLIVSSILTIGLSAMLDYTESIERPYLGFVIISLFLLLFGILSIYAVSHMDEVPIEKQSKRYSLKEVFLIPLKSQKYRQFVAFFALWQFSLQIAAPFIQVYMIKNLDLPYTFIMSMWVINVVGNIVSAKGWGRLTDRRQPYPIAMAATLLMAMVHVTWGFVGIQNYSWLVPLLSVGTGFAASGMNITMFGLQFLASKEEGRTMYLGLKAFIGGIFSFLAVSFGARILSFLNQGVQVGRFLFSNMQVTFIISGLLMFLCPVFIVFMLHNQGDH